MRSVGIGIIGSGGIACGAHLPGYKACESEGVRVVACSDINPETARRAAEQFDIPHVFTDYRQMLQSTLR